MADRALDSVFAEGDLLANEEQMAPRIDMLRMAPTPVAMAPPPAHEHEELLGTPLSKRHTPIPISDPYDLRSVP